MRATQLPILLALGSAGDVSLTRLAEALVLDGSTLSHNLKVLEDRGLIRVTKEQDPRARIASLTPEGSRVLTGALTRLQAVQQSLAAHFGRPRLQALYDELDALSAVVNE